MVDETNVLPIADQAVSVIENFLNFSLKELMQNIWLHTSKTTTPQVLAKSYLAPSTDRKINLEPALNHIIF